MAICILCDNVVNPLENGKLKKEFPNIDYGNEYCHECMEGCYENEIADGHRNRDGSRKND